MVARIDLVYKICAILSHTIQALIGGRSKRTGWLVYFLVSDVVCTGISIGLITILARAGVPTHCAGLTRTDCMEARDTH